MKELPAALAAFSEEEVTRLVDVLTDIDGLDISSREKFYHVFDDGTDGHQIEGVGVERAPIFRALWALTDAEWLAVTKIRIRAADAENTRIRPEDEPGLRLG